MDDPLAKFKLTPTPSDREVFHYILDNEYCEVRSKYGGHYWGNRVPKNTGFRALRAYDEFKKRIERFCKFGSSESGEGREELLTDETDTHEAIEERLKALLEAVLKRLKLVVITLGEEDDAQVIFETLNSRGEPLLAMDLVRNNIFHRADKQKASIDDLYKKLWDPFDAKWWRKSAPFSRPKRPRIDHFLAHILAAETGEKISIRELYAEYRAFAVPKGKPRFAQVEEELRLLERHAPAYEALEERKDFDGPETQILDWIVKRQANPPDEFLVWLGRKLAVGR